MTMPGSGRTWPVRDVPKHTPDDHLMRIVVATMNNAVDRLSRAATTRGLDTPVAAAHVHRLSQTVAGVTLDALRTWPSANE